VTRVGLALGAVVLLALGVWVLREQTMSRHEEQHPASRTEVVLDVSTNDAERPPAAMGRALVDACQFEVDARVVPGSWEASGDRRFRVVLRPALDDTDVQQFRGCVGDMRLDYVQAEVVGTTRLDTRA
jgi:hypothetical protein